MKMNKVGHIKSTTEDENGHRQFVINCIGANDQRKYFSISSFGTDFNPPENTRALAVESANKDESFSIGVLNKLKVGDLSLGERVIFSSNVEGTQISSYLKFRNDGTMEQNGDADFITGFNKMKAGFDTLRDDLNSLISAYNSHTHITTATVGASPTPGTITPTTSTGTPSSANIDASKKENLKTE